MKRVRIAYSLADHDFTRAKSIGVFNVATSILRGLMASGTSEELIVFVNSSLRDKLQPSDSAVFQYIDGALKSRAGRIIWDQIGLYKKAEIARSDWLFLPKGFASFLKSPPVNIAAYVHDTIHDFYCRNHPGHIPWFESKYFDKCLKSSIVHAKVIFTNSEFTRDELTRYAESHGLRLPKTVTAGIGFSPGPSIRKGKRNSLLLLTSAWPHKLTGKAVEYIARWQKESGFCGEINLVGSLPFRLRLPEAKGWRHHPRLSESDFRTMLAESRAMLFFSEYEGFGMPPVEAVIAGTCPVYSDLPVTREVMEGAGFSFSNGSYELFAGAVEGALNAPESEMRSWSEKLLQKHSWDNVIGRIRKELVITKDPLL